MYCVRCGRPLQDDDFFCRYCGTKTYQMEPANPLLPVGPMESNLQQTETYPETQIAIKTEESGMSLTSMLCGILAISLFWIVLPGIVLGLVALVFGIRSMVVYPEIKKGQAIAGLILGITAIALSALILSQLWGNPNIFLSLSNTNLNRL